MTSNTVYPLATSSWDTQEIDAINDVVASGRFTMGEKVAQFEKEFAEYFGSKYAVMTSSGSTANLIMIATLFYHSKYNLRRGEQPYLKLGGFLFWKNDYPDCSSRHLLEKYYQLINS